MIESNYKTHYGEFKMTADQQWYFNLGAQHYRDKPGLWWRLVDWWRAA